MAIARPVRALALAAVFMWCFFVWQIFRPSAGRIKLNDDPSLPRERDPNLDRKGTHTSAAALLLRGPAPPSCFPR